LLQIGYSSSKFDMKLDPLRGTVEEHERCDVAAIREAYEESGYLLNLEIEKLKKKHGICKDKTGYFHVIVKFREGVADFLKSYKHNFEVIYSNDTLEKYRNDLDNHCGLCFESIRRPSSGVRHAYQVKQIMKIYRKEGPPPGIKPTVLARKKVGELYRYEIVEDEDDISVDNITTMMKDARVSDVAEDAKVSDRADWKVIAVVDRNKWLWDCRKRNFFRYLGSSVITEIAKILRKKNGGTPKENVLRVLKNFGIPPDPKSDEFSNFLNKQDGSAYHGPISSEDYQIKLRKRILGAIADAEEPDPTSSSSSWRSRRRGRGRGRERYRRQGRGRGRSEEPDPTSSSSSWRSRRGGRGRGRGRYRRHGSGRGRRGAQRGGRARGGD